MLLLLAVIYCDDNFYAELHQIFRPSDKDKQDNIKTSTVTPPVGTNNVELDRVLEEIFGPFEDKDRVEVVAESKRQEKIRVKRENFGVHNSLLFA